MNRKKLSHLVILAVLLILPVVSYAQSTGQIVHQAGTGALMNSMDAITAQREQQKLYQKKQRELDPTWSPPKEFGVPYLGIEAGFSRFKGEYVGLRAAFGGFDIFGGIGDEWIFKNHSDKMLWHAGLGYFFGDIYDGSGETSIDITVGQTPLCEDISLMGSFSMGYFFGSNKRFGVRGTLGFGMGDLDRDEPTLIWEIGAGMVFKIFAD